MRLTDEMVELDDRKYRDWNVLAELKYMGREIKHRKAVTNDDLRFMAWLYRSALNMLKEQEAVEPEIEVLNEIDRLYRCPKCHKFFLYEKQKYCDRCGQEVKWNA